MESINRVLNRLARYFATGGVAAIVDIGLFGVFVFLGSRIFMAAVFSFVIAAVVNYCLTSMFVFDAKLNHVMFVKFFAFALIGLSINVGVTLFLAEALGFAALLSKIGGVGTAFLANFALNSGFVFNKPDDSLRGRPDP